MGRISRRTSKEFRKHQGKDFEQFWAIVEKTKQDIQRRIKMQTVDYMIIICFYILHTEFGFGGGRLHRLYDAIADVCGRLKSGETSIEEMNRQIVAETGMNIFETDDQKEGEEK